MKTATTAEWLKVRSDMVARGSKLLHLFDAGTLRVTRDAAGTDELLPPPGYYTRALPAGRDHAAEPASKAATPTSAAPTAARDASGDFWFDSPHEAERAERMERAADETREREALDREREAHRVDPGQDFWTRDDAKNNPNEKTAPQDAGATFWNE